MSVFPSVTLDGQEFIYRTNSVTGYSIPTDANGIEWLLTKFDGWTGRPAPRTARTDRPGHSGTFRSAAYHGPKIINLEITATAPDDITMRNAEIAMEALCSDPAQLYPVVVNETGITRVMMVELDDAILATPRLWNSTTFSIRLAAPDPRKHDNAWQSPIVNLGTPPIGGADFSSPGLNYSIVPGVDYGTPGTPSAAMVHNSGTAVAYPFFAVQGPLISNWQIVDVTNGVTLTFARALGATDSVVINCDDFPIQGFPGHGVFLNITNNQRPSLLTTAGWPYVLPGQTVTYNLRAPNYSATASMTVSLRSAWH
jgi:hypothetical protein